ncbi:MULTISPECIES: helix-turn-helix domain-containing protein [unclassified Sulfitobacter]|uniref:helix-turn-helix domain-containing protein n=2 Tax=Sulfitobacter TaxID=60136 RepID=UPI0007C3E696|nr:MULTISPECIES: helix-turn-helix domain-containing protein [unclassified Sulfitobacter]KZY05254.1 hypothetical protein A3721_15090 [Sulfitobacter sp. HI0023]KZY25602.1 hypothetical protein A3728_18515 [Sulfitobacter sp. HI0040]KZZ68848.1 hypothetical protein A3764_12115 [Sulfitobacter sp. HI0129]
MTPSETWEQMKVRHAREELAKLDQIATDAYCRGQAGAAPSRADRPMQIIYSYAREAGVSVDMLRGGDRTKRACRHRHEVMLRLKEETDLSLPAIGRLLGGRDHTTIMNGIERAKAKREAAQ